MSEALGPINLVVLIPPAVALLWTVRLVYGRRGATSDDILKQVMSTAGWLLLLVGLIGMVVGTAGPFSILAIVVLPAVLIMAVGQFRQSERRALLDMLGIAAERGIPLESAARAFADERGDELGLRAAHLADLLEAGMPLPEALSASGHYYLPTDARLAVRMGTETGSLGPALKNITGMGQTLETTLRTLSVKYLYLIVLFNVGVLILTFVMLKIVPTFAKMFDEFGLTLPAPTLFLVALSNKVVKLSPLMAPIWLFFLTWLFAAGLHYVGWLPRWLPVVSRLTLRYDGALVMRTLALAVSQERSLVETIRLLTAIYPLSPVRKRLARAMASIDKGGNWADALVSVGLIRPSDAGVLKAAQRVGNLEWALNQMAEGSLRRAAYRWQSIVNVVGPLVILLMGMVVGFIVISLFMPLISMIAGLSGPR